MGTLPRSILKGVDTVGEQERELCFGLGNVVLIAVGSVVVASEDPVVEWGLLWSSVLDALGFAGFVGLFLIVV